MDKLNGTQIAILFGTVCLAAGAATGLALKALNKRTNYWDMPFANRTSTSGSTAPLMDVIGKMQDFK